MPGVRGTQEGPTFTPPPPFNHRKRAPPQQPMLVRRAYCDNMLCGEEDAEKGFKKAVS